MSLSFVDFLRGQKMRNGPTVVCGIVFSFLAVMIFIGCRDRKAGEFEQNQKELQGSVEDLQDNIQKMNKKIDELEKTELEIQRMVEQIRKDIQKMQESISAFETKKYEEIKQAAGTGDSKVGDTKTWKDEYVITLSPVDDIREFGVNWYKPIDAKEISDKMPKEIKRWPRAKYKLQKSFKITLGDADDNEIIALMDFKTPEEDHFPFDLYLDKDRDLNLAEDFIENKESIRGIKVAYKDGSTENYSMKMHSYYYSSESGNVGITCGSHTGRRGVIDTGEQKIPILIYDNNCNGIFSDADDYIFVDWDLDGRINGKHDDKEYRSLYSPLELQGGKYKVAEIDPAGRRLVLKRQKNN